MCVSTTANVLSQIEHNFTHLKLWVVVVRHKVGENFDNKIKLMTWQLKGKYAA